MFAPPRRMPTTWWTRSIFQACSAGGTSDTGLSPANPDLSFVESAMEVTTVGEMLYWAYANLAMAHSAVTSKAEKYGRTHFIIRSRLYKELCNGSMNIGSFADEKRLKMILPRACCYCGSKEHLAIDHLIPRKKGGANSGDNLVWACSACNSSKCATDALALLASRQQFPPLLLFRRYLKLAIELGREKNVMDAPLNNAPNPPFDLNAIPSSFPQPSALVLWVAEQPPRPR